MEYILMEKAIRIQEAMNVKKIESADSLLQLPDTALACVLQCLDAKGLNTVSKTSKYFNMFMPCSGLRLTEHIARNRVLELLHGDNTAAERFKYLEWRERLFLEENSGCGFDINWCENFGFRLEQASEGKDPVVRLLDMGPKLLLSNASTADQSILRWRLRVTGNTAVEFGVVPVDLEMSQNSLHKTDFVKGYRDQRCTGFCSQITAGSHLPVKVPIVRGTIVDLVGRRGSVEIVLIYPNDAQEIKWNRDGHPVPSPYQGPRVLRFEIEYPKTFDVKLAVTCWAKASFDILHSGIDKTYGMSESIRSEEPQAQTDMEIEQERTKCVGETLERASSAPNVLCSASETHQASKDPDCLSSGAEMMETDADEPMD